MSAEPEKNTREKVVETLSANRDLKSNFEKEYCKLLEHLLDNFDFQGYEDLKAFHMSDASPTLKGRYKYLDICHYLRSKLRSIISLGLHRAAPMKIHDLGTGPAHFPFLCKHFGHEVSCSDVPSGCWEGSVKSPEELQTNELLSSEGETIYEDLSSFFGLKRLKIRVEPFQPLPDLGNRFDLITAFMVKFHEYWASNELWEEAEWRFFFDDLQANHLTPDGRVYLRMNRGTQYTGLKPDSEEFSSIIGTMGGAVSAKDCIITMPAMD